MGSNTALALVLCSGVLVLALGIMGLLSHKNHFPVDGRTIIVTGASQGLGLSIAKLLAAKGANVFIVARDVGKLEASVREITASAKSPQSQRFHYLSADLCDPESSPRILAAVTQWNSNTPPDVVWCCAGYSIPGFFASSSIETLRGQMDTVYWTAAYMAHAALNSWIRGQKAEDRAAAVAASKTTPAVQADNTARHLIFTASTISFFAIAGYAPYAPAKAAMRHLADTLNQEVAVYNGARRSINPGTSAAPAADIQIHTLFPMGILTPGYEHENSLKPALTLMLEEADKPQHPDDVAQTAISRLERGDKLITTSLLGGLMKGAGMGASIRTGIADVFWNALGSVVILFVGPDFVNKCWQWGKEKGMDQAR